MANKFYPKAVQHFAQGDLRWKPGGDNFKAVLIDTAAYTYSDAQEFLADIPAPARVWTTGLLSVLTPTSGVLDAADVTVTGPTGTHCEAVAIFQDTGNAATSLLVLYIDSATGLPVTPTGVNILIAWSDDTMKIGQL